MRTPAITRRQFIASLAVAGAAAVVGEQVTGPRAAAQGSTPAAKEDVPQLLPTVCGMCQFNCGIVAYVEGGRLLKLEGNHYHSHSRGHICARGSAGVRLLYDPDRLSAPLKRVREGQFAQVSWEQAFAEIGQTLSKLREQYGPQTLVWARQPDPADDWDRQFAAAFGTPNIFSPAAIGNSARNVACQATLGWVPMSDLARTKYVVAFGRNFAESIFVSDLTGLMAAKDGGAKVVVVDPRLSNTAAQAHEWIPIRPGSDGALLLGMINVIINERLYDEQFVTEHVQGFAELSAYVAGKTPGWAATETDIPSDTIKRLARELAAAKPACAVDPSRHAAWGAMYGNSLYSARAALTLNALLGVYGAPGGLLRPLAPETTLGAFQPPATPPVTAPRADQAFNQVASFLAPTDGVVQALPDIILSEKPYPIKAMIVRHFNPAHSLPNAGKVRQALSKLDLLVAIDVMPSDTAEMAHYILPESTYLERSDPPVLSRAVTAEVAWRQPVVQRLQNTKPPAEIIAGLAVAVGLGKYFGFSVEDVSAARLQRLNISPAELRDRGVWQSAETWQPSVPEFATPSGKIEVFSEQLQAAGFEPLPVYQPPLVRPEGGNAFRLIHGREPLHSGTWTHNNGWLHALSPENRLVINSQRAVRLGLQDGDEALVRSDVGEVRVRVQLTEGIHPQAVFLAHGYGNHGRMQRLASGSGVNDNDLIVDRTDAAGSAATCETIVRVVKA